MVYHSDEKPRALITGIGGFTGAYLEKELQDAGYDVYGITDVPVPGHDTYVVCNLLDRESLRKTVSAIRPEIVAHLAAVSFVAYDDVDMLYRVNITGTRNLLSALAECDSSVQCILLASSANIYGNSDRVVIDESCPPAPINDYAISKLAMEYLARIWMDRLPITIVRPFNYTGVGQPQHFLVPKIIRHFRDRSLHIELGNLDVIRDFSDVKYVTSIYRRLLQKAPAGEIFNVCSGVAISLKQIIQSVSSLAGYQIDIRVNSAFVRNNEVKQLIGSSNKLNRCIGSIPSVPFDETLRWMFESIS